MLSCRLRQASLWRQNSICCLYAVNRQPQWSPFQWRAIKTKTKTKTKDKTKTKAITAKPLKVRRLMADRGRAPTLRSERSKTADGEASTRPLLTMAEIAQLLDVSPSLRHELEGLIELNDCIQVDEIGGENQAEMEQSNAFPMEQERPKSLKEALLSKRRGRSAEAREDLAISVLFPDDLTFEPLDVKIPPVPMLSYGLDRVLFNPGIYLLQDPRSRVYNFDPYLEKIMPVDEFDFDALSEYKTSSKDDDLLALTREANAKYTGSTSSMSGILQHFHFLLSQFRRLNHNMLSREYPEPSSKFSKITLAPSAVFLRYKDGVYAIDADKSYDEPNIMSWLGHSLEKLLTTEQSEFERYRRSSPVKAPAQDNSSRCYHYSKQGNFLMRSQLDAVDPRLPGTGVFDLKTRAVVSIRMNHKEYEEGSGYQLRKSRGEWESFEREFYDMTRATLLKYSLQVRMGRMDGIFIAFHNIQRIFGFQYLSISDMDAVLHGQYDTCLGDREFKLSIALLDELLSRATAQFPNTSIRLHFESREVNLPFMYIFAEPVTEGQADHIQASGEAAQKNFARTVVGLGKKDPEVQAAWHSIQDEVDQQVDKDKNSEPEAETQSEGLDQNTSIDEALVEGQLEHIIPLEEGVEYMDSELKVETQSEEEEVGDSHEEPMEESISLETTLGTDTGFEAEKGDELLDEDSVEQATRTKADDTAKANNDSEENTAEESSNVETSDIVNDTSTVEPGLKAPLIGWTLTIRNKVNGDYVERPEKMSEQDEWKIEYHIQDIPEGSCQRLYEAVTRRRSALVGHDNETVDKSLQNYRELIQRYTDQGREWRKEQDKMDEEKGVLLYRPLGPGSEVETVQTGGVDEDAMVPPQS